MKDDKKVPRKKSSVQGAADYEITHLSEDCRKQIQEELMHRKINYNDENFNSFIETVEQEAAYLNGQRQLEKESSTSNTRKNLKETFGITEELYEKLGRIDPDSITLIFKASNRTVEDFSAGLWTLMSALNMAKDEAESYPDGRRAEKEKDLFVAKIIKAYERHLGVDATLTREGPFEAIVRIIMKDVDGCEVEYIHKLLERAHSITITDV